MSKATKGKSKKATKAQATDLDQWGSIKGSSNAKVNAALMKAQAPLTFADICKKTGLTGKQVRYAHLAALEKAKHIKKDGKAWRLV